MGYRFAQTFNPLTYKGATALGNRLRLSKNSRRG
jgi:hypothetical protein